MKGSRSWFVPVLLFAAIGGFMFFHVLLPTSPGNGRARHAQGANQPAPSREIQRPRHWLPDRPFPPAPTREQVERFDGAIRGFEHAPLPPSDAEPLTDSAVRARIEEARQSVLRERTPSGAWEWRSVRAVLVGIGTRYPLLAAGAERQRRQTTGLFSFDPVHGQFEVFTQNVMRYSTEMVSGMLVHEATHAVFLERWRSMSGFTLPELTVMNMSCVDVNIVATVCSESLAHINQSIWTYRQAEPEIPDYDFIRDMLLAARDLRTRPDALSLFARGMFWYADRQVSHHENRRDQACSVPIMIRGPRRGDYFTPSDIAPEILVPILDAPLRP